MASIKVVLYTSKTLKDGTHPIMFRYTLNRKSKYVSTGFSCHEKEWDRKNNCPSRKHPNKEELTNLLISKLTLFRKKVIELQEEDKQLSAEEFQKTATLEKQSKSFFEFSDRVIAEFHEIGKIKTASSFNDAKRIFHNFRKGKDIRVVDS